MDMFKQKASYSNVKDIFLKLINSRKNFKSGMDRLTKVGVKKKIEDSGEKFFQNYAAKMKTINGYKFRRFKILRKIIIDDSDVNKLEEKIRYFAVASLYDYACLDIIKEYLDTLSVRTMPVEQTVERFRKHLIYLSKEQRMEEYSIFRIDIKSFFDNIPHEKLNEVLKKRKCSPIVISHVNNLLDVYKLSFCSNRKKAFGNNHDQTPKETSKDEKKYDRQSDYNDTRRVINFKRGIPQGINISSVLANIYLEEIKNQISRKFPSYEIIKYVDDIVILGKFTEKAEQEIRNIFADFKLELNDEKTSLKSFNKDQIEIDYLGRMFTIIRNNKNQFKISEKISKEALVKFINSIEYEFFTLRSRMRKNKDKNNQLRKNIAELISFQARVNSRITGYYNESNNGVGFIHRLKHVDEEEFKKIDEIIKKIKKRYIETNKIRIKSLFVTFENMKKSDLQTYIPRMKKLKTDESMQIDYLYNTLYYPYDLIVEMTLEERYEIIGNLIYDMDVTTKYVDVIRGKEVYENK